MRKQNYIICTKLSPLKTFLYILKKDYPLITFIKLLTLQYFVFPTYDHIVASIFVEIKLRLSQSTLSAHIMHWIHSKVFPPETICVIDLWECPRCNRLWLSRAGGTLCKMCVDSVEARNTATDLAQVEVNAYSWDWATFLNAIPLRIWRGNFIDQNTVRWIIDDWIIFVRELAKMRFVFLFISIPHFMIISRENPK